MTLDREDIEAIAEAVVVKMREKPKKKDFDPVAHAIAVDKVMNGKDKYAIIKFYEKHNVREGNYDSLY